MKKSVLLFSFILIFNSLIFAQEIIENPEKPLSKNASRVIQLKELMRIKEVSGKFYFKWADEVKVSSDGSIYVQESGHLYEFNAAGEFIKDYYRKGEGPGEFNQNLRGFLLEDDEIIPFSSNMKKIVRIARNGNLIEDIRPKKLFSYILARYNSKYYFAVREVGKYPKSTGIYNDYLKLLITNEAGETSATPYIFPFTVSLNVHERGFGWLYISRLLAVRKKPRYVFFSVTPEYLVNLWDLEKNTIKSFRRKYNRVRFIEMEKSPILVPKYINDICGLLIYNDNLWVLTSTFLREKGLLVDVFDLEGRYLDNFYLPLLWIRMEGNIAYHFPMTIQGNYLFVVEQDEDGLISIVKYEIID